MKNRFSFGKAVRTLAASVDTIVIPLLLTAAVLPVFHRTNRHRFAPVVYLLCFLLLLALRYLNKLKRKKRLALKEREDRILEKLVLAEDEELERIMGEGFVLIRKAQPDLFDLSEVVRRKAKSVGLFGCDGQNLLFLKRNAPETVIYTREDLMIKLDPDLVKTRGNVFELAETFIFHNRYFLLGMAFYCVSFWVGSKIYYRFVSGICLIIALFTGLIGNLSGRKKL